jgi:hypothetical protein
MRKKSAARVRETPAQFYDAHGVLGEIEDEPVEVTLDEALRADIVEGRRARRLQNVKLGEGPRRPTRTRRASR